jgi:hypothetical protein
MKIDNKIAENILETSLQLEKYYDIGIAYSCPYGIFLKPTDKFILINNFLDEDCEKKEYYLVINNEFQVEHEGILTKVNTELDQKNDDIINFLIDFHLYLKNGSIKIFEYKEFNNFRWKETGTEKYHFEIKENYCTTSWMDTLENLKNTNPDFYAIINSY